MEMHSSITERLRADFGNRVARLHFPSIEGGTGRLTPFDLAAVPLTVVRAFLVTAQSGALRGGHAHVTGNELLVRLSGEIEVELSYRGATATIMLDTQNNALLIGSPVWSRQLYHGPSASLLVFCDTLYEPSAYVHDSLIPPLS
jgi:hypothetical protein